MKTVFFYVDQDAKIRHAENASVLYGSEEDWEGMPMDELLSPPYSTISFKKVMEDMKRGLSKYKTVIWEILQKSTGKKLVVQLAASFVEKDVYLMVVDEYKDDECSITLDCNGKIRSCGSQCVEFFGYPSTKIEEEGISLLFGMNQTNISELLGESGEANRSLIGKHGSGNNFYCNVNIKKKNFGPVSIFVLKLQKVNPMMESCFLLNPDGTIDSFSKLIFECIFGFEIELEGKPLGSILQIEEDEKSFGEKSEEDLGDRDAKRRKVVTINSPPEKFEWKGDGEHITKFFGGNMKHIDGSIIPVSIEFYSFITAKGEKKSAVSLKRIMMKISKYYGKWELCERIGSGMGGKVIAAKHRDSGLPAAIKVIKKRSLVEEELYGRVKKESEIMMQLDHPNIIKLYEVLETNSELMIVMELVTGGQDLLNFVKEGNSITEEAARVVFQQILSALIYCHSKQIFHRDIKHDNLLVNTNSVVKLIDFGLSRKIEEGGTMRHTYCGTLGYSAPEMVLGKEYAAARIDVWSLGVVFYALMSKGELPFETVSDIISKEVSLSSIWSSECQDLVLRMLERDCDKRITLSEISSHPWMLVPPSLKADKLPIPGPLSRFHSMHPNDQLRQTR